MKVAGTQLIRTVFASQSGNKLSDENQKQASPEMVELQAEGPDIFS